MTVYSYSLNYTTFDPSRFLLAGTFKFAFFKTHLHRFYQKQAGKPLIILEYMCKMENQVPIKSEKLNRLYLLLIKDRSREDIREVSSKKF